MRLHCRKQQKTARNAATSALAGGLYKQGHRMSRPRSSSAAQNARMCGASISKPFF